MLLGTSKVCITPPLGVWMDGYAFRIKPCASVSEDIFVRVHVHRCEARTVVYIYADIAHWDNLTVAAGRKMLWEKYGLREEELVFMASHSHSGPVTGSDALLILPCCEDPSYTSFLLEQVVIAVGEALSDMKQVTVTRYNGTCRQNVFRRVIENGEVLMAPNYDIPADRHLTVLAMQDAEGKMLGMVVHYPCHANLANGYDIHPDYPGVALRMLDETYPGCVSLFMQGCTGDLRPNSVCGDNFVPSQYDKVLKFAERFYNICIKTMEGRGIPVKDGLHLACEKLPLPLVGTKPDEALERLTREGSDFQKAWAAKVLERGNLPEETLELMQISYGSGLIVYTFNAEVVQSYAEFARRLHPDAICTAYVNGMIGYISDAKETVEGGYEPAGSAPYFALAGTYSIETEVLIHDAIQDLYKNNNHTI